MVDASVIRPNQTGHRQMTDPAATSAGPVPTILHPTDFSPASEVAFVHALRMALALKARFYILHFDREAPEAIAWDAFPGVRDHLVRWGLLETGSPPEAVFERHGVRVGKVDIVGRNPVDAIVGFLDEHPADLIVLATHGHDGAQRWLHSEVAEPVARRARAPTLFFPPAARPIVDPASGQPRLERVLVPTDRSPRPEPAVRGAAQLAAALGAASVPFELLHVGTERDLGAVELPPDLAGPVEVTTRQGPVVDTIVQTAADPRISLIAMATEGRRGFLDALRGSTTEHVVRQSPVPVLAVPVI